MCGIIGILGKHAVAPLLLEGLKRLEYRGYDSSGMASLVNGHIDIRRAEGKIVNLEAKLAKEPLSGTTGIAHTRWATHGRPIERNAHPITTDRVAIVHNGIIENFEELRAELSDRSFHTDTDTEAVAQLLTQYLEEGKNPSEAMTLLMARLKGAFSLAIIIAGQADMMIGARRGSPLAIGYGDGEMYLGSDALALSQLTDRICYMEEDDWVILSRDHAQIFNNDRRVNREVMRSALSGALIGKGKYRHYMMKEMNEQPAVIGDVLTSMIDPIARKATLPQMSLDWKNLPRLTILGCGTAYLAGLVGKYWLEKIARLPVEVDIASEFRYRQGPMPIGGAALIISQSGETIDSLAALRYARQQKQKIISLLNSIESTIGRESDYILPTQAGPEICVASTKAFTTQLAVLGAMTLQAARERGQISAEQEAELTNALIELPSRIAEILNRESEFEKIAQSLVHCQHALYLGRGYSYPLALEGALKLKELSYIHAEGYPAGEMKHGPIALIDENMPVIVIAPYDEWFEKTYANVQEVRARGGRAICFTNQAGAERMKNLSSEIIALPDIHSFAAPILYAIPVQLLAYFAALARGTDVDQPRNLAKSVTVE